MEVKTPSLGFNPLDYPILLQDPEHLTDIRNWHEHIPFAFALIQMLRPKIFVELGTHKGDSYCAFCQAVASLNTETLCYAVDTWEGDKHSEEYSSSIYQDLYAYHEARYSGFSTMLKTTFDEAIANFSDLSIDLLHIDGLHTYEAIKHDFENWLPKMTKRGVIILHDVNVYKGFDGKDFGVWQFWHELQARYPNMEFKHGYGLGLVAVGEEIPESLACFFDNPELYSDTIRYFAFLGKRVALLHSKAQEIKRFKEDQVATQVHIQNLTSLFKQEQKATQDHIQNLTANFNQEREAYQANLQHLAQTQSLVRMKAETDLQNQIRSLTHQVHLLTAENGNLRGESTWLEQNRARLHQKITLLEAELKSLKATRTVRLSRRLGLIAKGSLQVVRDFKYGPVQGAIDLVELSSDSPPILKVTGWATSISGWIQQVEVSLDQVLVGSAYYGIERLDVKAERPLQMDTSCGYLGEFRLDPALFPPSTKTLRVCVRDNKGHQQEYSQQVVIEPPTKPLLEVTTLTPYEEWMINSEPSELELEQQRTKALALSYLPLISILTPVYNPSSLVLRATLESVLNQTYPNWELCLVDGASTLPEIKTLLSEYARRDTRIRVKFLEKNLGISENSNRALDMIKGEFIALLDHDDTLTPDALYENVLLLNSHPEADMIYSDEDKLDAAGKRCDPYFKPDWAPDFFLSQMYTCHLGVYRTSLIQKIGGFNTEFNGTQDYDLVLRLIEQTTRIYHIPKILYHWRKSAKSTSAAFENKAGIQDLQIKVVQAHCQRVGLEAVVKPGLESNTLRVKYLLKEWPRVSIIIPTRDQVQVLKQCLTSIKSFTNYPNYEIIIVDNDSSESTTLEYLEELKATPGFKVLKYAGSFNFSAINNFAVSQVESELILLLNNDIEVIEPDWLASMVEHAVRPEVGAVGARLLYPNQTLQHGGVIIGIGGVAGHSHKYIPANESGYFCRAKAIQNFSAVTAACLMTRTSIFRSVGGLDEQNLAIAFNDVDFCLKIREKGLLIVWTPFAELIHHESVSRGPEDNPEKIRRFQSEIRFMYRRWANVIRHDPYYNPNLTLETENFALAPRSRFTSAGRSVGG